MGVLIKNIGQDGKLEDISQGTGIGIREHKDVMLSWGYSNKITKKFTLPSGQFGVLSLRVPAGVNHHAESRFLQVYNAPTNFKIIVGKTVADLPEVVEQIPAFNQKYAVLNTEILSIIEWRGLHVSNPITGITTSNTIDDLNLYAQTGQGLRASTAEVFSSLSGRYYTGLNEERVIIALFENIDSGDAEVEFVYAWHEYE